MSALFTTSHRGGTGPPLVLLHGFMDTWRIWELVLPAVQCHHDVLAPTLPGHAGGPPLEGDVVDAIERAMDEAGFATAHVAGNSAGGYLALRLAARGRARTVVALAPAGGWAQGDESWRDLLAFQADLLAQAKAAAPTSTRSSPRARAAGARRRRSSATTSTSPPTCCGTSCWAWRAAAAPRP